jgi:hypothetical protein
MGFKIVEVLRGDTLQKLSLRELGDASKWVDIALLNSLRPPYLADDAVSALDGMAYAGQTILIPIQADNAIADTHDQFLTDLALPNGKLQVENGDWVLVSGNNNLVQALRNRVMVRKRSLWFHPEYGCWVHSLLGKLNGPSAGGLAAFYVKSSILEDIRVASIESIIAEVTGDVIRVNCVVVPIYGESIAFEQVI